MTPSYERDLFAPSALADPFPHYRSLRDLGPVVRLGDPDVFAIPRFKDVQAALRSPEILISGKGVAFNPMLNATSSIIQSDGAEHLRSRGQLLKPLMPSELKQKRAELKTSIVDKVAEFRGAGWIDGVAVLAQHLPVSIVSFMVGLPEAGRTNMLRWAAAAFNTLGPMRGHLQDDVASIVEALQFIDNIDPETLRPGSWGAALFAGVAEGRLSEAEARGALQGYVLPSLDTTIYAQSNLLYNLGADEEQWRLLRAQPELISNAVLESVRHSAVVRWFSRVAARDYAVEDHIIPEGARVMIMYGSANRDERRYANPDRFDITRNSTDQLGWGTGPHICAGKNLARMEMELLVEALVEGVERIEVGAPVVGVNQGLYGYTSLPLRLH